MAYTWYKIFNEDEFNELDLVSKTYTLDLENVGVKDILVTKGVSLGITYEGVFLSLDLNDENPAYFDGYGIAREANGDINLGILNDET